MKSSLTCDPCDLLHEILCNFETTPGTSFLRWLQDDSSNTFPLECPKSPLAPHNMTLKIYP